MSLFHLWNNSLEQQEAIIDKNSVGLNIDIVICTAEDM